MTCLNMTVVVEKMLKVQTILHHVDVPTVWH